MNLIFTLAFRNLFHDRLRLIATVVGIVFSIVLVTVQLGVFLSFERMVTTMIDHADADFWIVPPETRSFEESSLLSGRQRLQALSVDGVISVTPLVVGYASWRKPATATCCCSPPESARGPYGPARRWRARAMFIVTHDPRIMPFADRILRIEDGRIVDDQRGGANVRALRPLKYTS